MFNNTTAKALSILADEVNFGTTEVLAEEWATLSTNTNLKSFVLWNDSSNINDAYAKGFQIAMKKNVELMNLDIHFSKCKNLKEGATYLLKGLTDMTKVRKIDLWMNESNVNFNKTA